MDGLPTALGQVSTLQPGAGTCPGKGRVLTSDKDAQDAHHAPLPHEAAGASVR